MYHSNAPQANPYTSIYTCGDSTKVPGTHLGNDQQLEVFDYLRQYRKSRLSFARATQLQTPQQELPLISWAANIVEQASECHGGLLGQLSVTLNNITHLIAKSDKTHASLSFMRVYLRRAEELSAAQKFSHNHFSALARVVLLSDICRAGLLVEIECV